MLSEKSYFAVCEEVLRLLELAVLLLPMLTVVSV